MLNIVVLPGDGIGPEVIAPAVDFLKVELDRRGREWQFQNHQIGGSAIDATGDPLPQATLDACLQADAILLGAVGGPKWDNAPRRPEQGLLELRKALGLFANIRPVRCGPEALTSSALKPEICDGVDLVIVRELTGGLYFGEKRVGQDWASDECRYERGEIERVARVAFELARQRRRQLTSVDKANVLATSRLWRSIVIELGKRDYPDVEVSHEFVDAAAMKLITQPRRFDVIVTENLFGDILSDVAAAIPGSIGKLGSASLGVDGRGLFEPIHGSAPAIAGKGLADPTGAIESARMLVAHLERSGRKASLARWQFKQLTRARAPFGAVRQDR